MFILFIELFLNLLHDVLFDDYNTHYEYQIEISLTPQEWYNKSEPYFWTIYEIDNGNKNNYGCGWAQTPELAYQKAKDYYDAVNNL